MAPMQARSLLGVPLLALAVACASAAKVSPLHKVVELLEVLQHQIEADAKTDGTMYMEYKTWYDAKTEEMKRVIEDTNQLLETLKSDLEEQEAFRMGKKHDFEQAANKLAQSQKELKDATDIRDKERKDFVASERSLVTGVDQLERSLEVMGKQAPLGASALQEALPGTSMIEVAEKLKDLFEGDASISLTVGQRETLHAFVSAAKRDTDSARQRSTRGGQASLAPDFLQEKMASSADPDVYGDYDSQGGTVVSTLQSVLDKVQEELEKARLAEESSKAQYDTFAESVNQEITNLESTKVELKTQISQSQQKSSEMQSQLVAATEMLRVTGEQLHEVEAAFAAKTQNFKIRAGKRSDEIIAVQEAHQILQSDAMAGLKPLQTIGSPDFMQLGIQRTVKGRAAQVLAKAASNVNRTNKAPPSLLQTGQESMRARRARRRAQRAQRFALRQHGGPFGKVKRMVREMLTKLEDQQAQESKHKEWCDREMKKSLHSKAEQEADVQKLSSRIDSMDADMEQLKTDVNSLTEDLKDLNAASRSASKIRKEEHENAVTSIAQYKDAQKIIKASIDVLKKFYGEDDVYKVKGKDAPTGENDYKGKSGGDDGYKASGMGSGVVGILEVAMQDYSELQQQAELSETESQNDYNEFANENQVREAVFEKDLEYKSRNKVQLEGDLMRASADLKSYEKELEAVNQYLAQLQSQCVGKVDSYQERKDRREKQLGSLKEALDYLTGEGI
jgi:septal ring factor EnvC (AmiA/AmiB activator)